MSKPKIFDRRTVLPISLFLAVLFGMGSTRGCTSERRQVREQQVQYSIAQPIPKFDWSLERQLIIDLYRLRNEKVSTHAVWRSDYGMIEGDCPSMGFGLPYDTSLTNPLMIYSGAVIEQAEPNGIYSSKNTAATWVMCVGDGGSIEPVYVESKVTIYPGPVKVDYESNRVTRTGATSVRILTGQ